MPWKPEDATRHTKNAKTKKLKRIWAAAANSSLSDDGDEGKAVRIANAAVDKQLRKSQTLWNLLKSIVPS